MDGFLFDIQEIWEEILNHAREAGDREADFLAYLEKTYPNPRLEDFVFYKKYLSRFVLNNELRDKEFLVDEDLDLTREECLLLMRLAAASFSSTYDLEYLPEEDKLELTFHVTSGDESITKKLQDLYDFQVYPLYRIYLEEQLHLECYMEDGMIYDDEQDIQVSIFEKQMARCVDQLHGAAIGRSAARRIEEKLDELLRS